MLLTLVLLLVVAGLLGALLLRNSSATGNSILAARVGRFGLTTTTDTITVSSPAQKEQNAIARSMERTVGNSFFGQGIARDLERADLKMTSGEFLTLNLISLLVGTLVGSLLLDGPISAFLLGALGSFQVRVLAALAGAGLGLIAPRLYLWRRIRKRSQAFVEQLADMAQMMANSMRAGFSVLQSMELVARDAPEPASHEFARVVSEVKLGLPLDVALEHLLERMPSEDLGLMVVAINVQRQIGGNLAEILSVIAHTVRERVRFQREVRTLTAQARYSSYVITALPIGVALIINLIAPSYEGYLYRDPVGHILIGTALLMVSLGFFLLRKIANIEI